MIHNVVTSKYDILLLYNEKHIHFDVSRLSGLVQTTGPRRIFEFFYRFFNDTITRYSSVTGGATVYAKCQGIA